MSLAAMINDANADGEAIYDCVWLSDLAAGEWYEIPGPTLFEKWAGFAVPGHAIDVVEVPGGAMLRLEESLHAGYGLYRRSMDG